MFDNFKAAADSAPRDQVMLTLVKLGTVLNLLAAIPQERRIIIDEGMAEIPLFRQTIGSEG